MTEKLNWITRLKGLLAEPASKGLEIDAPETTVKRRAIIQGKRLLRDIYEDWYAQIAAQLPPGDLPVLELGSGAGFFKEVVPEAITSDVFPCPGVDRVIDARKLPFADGSLRAITMVDVLHHIPESRVFFREAARCVVPDGAIVMIEPWVSLLSRVVWGKLHHEPFRPDAESWEFPTTGPLSGANGALPWMLFVRDRRQFEQEFPEWEIKTIRPFSCLRYLASGGVSLRALSPGWTSGMWYLGDRALAPLRRWVSLFALLVLVRRFSRNT